MDKIVNEKFYIPKEKICNFVSGYTLKNNKDKTYFVLSIGGENEFKGGWILGGDVGAHDKDLSASIMLRKVG